MKAFLSELNRRNVTRTALFYATASWLIVQIVVSIFPVFNIPEWLVQLIIIVLAIGFFPVIAFSWIYEITPEGIKKEKDIESDDSIRQQTGKKLNIAVIVILLITAGIYLWPEPSKDFPKISATETEVEQKAASNDKASKVVKPTEILLERGLAILPFENLSANQENSFFASGVHEDVLTHFSSLEAFRVISRTSVKQYAKTTKSMSQIANELGISHIVEGSIRRAGDTVRISVQLIDGSNDKQVWAQNFDRKLIDIFAIQSEIALKIATQIKQEISPAEVAFIQRDKVTTTLAYDLYLRANELLKDTSARTTAILDEPYRLLKRAVQEDSKFLDAWSSLGIVCSKMVWWDKPEYKDCAFEAVKKVKELSPDSPEFSFISGVYAYYVENNYRNALTLFERSALARPNNYEMQTFVSFVARRLQIWTTALDFAYKATLLNPQYVSGHQQYIATLVFAGNWQKALAKAEEATYRFPNNSLSKFVYANLKRRFLGDMVGYAEAINALDESLRSVYGSPFIEGGFGNDQERIDWVKGTTRSSPLLNSRLNALKSILALINGNTDLSEEFAKQAFVEFQNKLPPIEKLSPFFISIMAYSAAMAGEVDVAEQAIAAYFALPNIQTDILQKLESHADIMLAHALLDQYDEAWKLAEDMLRSDGGWTIWDLKHDIRMQHHFADWPQFQALMAQADTSVKPISRP